MSTQLELFVVLLALVFLAALPMVLAAKRHRVRAVVFALLVSVLVANLAFTQESGKPPAPALNAWCKFKVEWAQFTHAIRDAWSSMVNDILSTRRAVDAIDRYITAPTNTPTTLPPSVQLHYQPADNTANLNFKAQVERLDIAADGVVTVTVRTSRGVSDAPRMQMYLRSRKTGAFYWAHHESTSYPETAGAPNTYTYSFRPPVNIETGLIYESEILLGGQHGLTVGGLVYVDPGTGQMYEGLTGRYTIGEGEDARTVSLKGGQFMIEAAAMAAEAEPVLFANDTPKGMMRVSAGLGAKSMAVEQSARTIKLSMPPIDVIKSIPLSPETVK